LGSLQKKTFNYVEANQKKREQYLEKIKDINPDDIIYSDEAGIDDNEAPPKGWGPVGKRLFAKKKGIRKARYNITAALNKGKLFAPFVFEGYSNASTYATYVEQVLVPQLRPGMVLIIDNARFHKSKKVVELIESAQCRIIFLPPYSPDLNPIEHYWSAMKARIRKAAEAIQDFYEATIKAVGEMCTTY
jgi:transposase